MKSLRGKSVLIRADSAREIGAGHIARTVVLANALRDAGASVTYACRNYEGSFISLLKKREHTVRSLPAFNEPKKDKISTWLGADIKQDIEQAFAGESYDMVIVDHPGTDISWHQAARKRAKKIFCIDDEAQDEVDCDILLNQNLLANPDEAYKNKAPARCKLLLGPQYALLRHEFSEIRKRSHVRTKLQNILIIMGGGDPMRINEKVLKNLSLPLHVTVVVGDQYKNFDALNAFCARKGHTVLQQVDNMAELFLQTDFCIGAGGNTSWERCCLYLPSALFMLSENQRLLAENLAVRGGCKFLGPVDEYDFTGIDDMLRPYLETPSLLQDMSETAGSLCDGQGAERVLAALEEIV